MSIFEPIPMDGVQQESKIDFSRMHKEATTDLKNPPSRPPLAISIGTTNYSGQNYPLRFGTYGNISMIKGEEKSRKSFLKSMLLACAIGGNANYYNDEIRGHDLEGKYIFDIDTEQDDYDVWLNAKRIPEMVGQTPPYYQSVKLRRYKQEEIAQYLEWLFMESQFKDKLGIVSIDGYVDCMKDFNSLHESTEFTKTLMRYSSIAKCHITGILHLNPNSDKARGHLGTILQQKCETVVQIKDHGDFSSVKCQRARGMKWDTFTIRIDENWLPYVSEDEIGTEKPQVNF